MRWVFAGVSVVLSLVLCDLALTAGSHFSPRLQYYLNPPWARAVVADPVLGWRMSPFYPGHDKRGYRNERQLETAEVLAIGDSLTYGYAAPADQSWPRQLQSLSNKTTFNAGVGGYGPCEYEIELEQLLELRPGIVLIGLYLGNDIADAYRSVYLSARCQRYRATDPATLKSIHLAESKAPISPTERRLLVGDADDEGIDGMAPKSWMRWSALYRLGRNLYWTLGGESRSPFRETSDPRDSFETASKRPLRLAYTGDGRFRTVFRDPSLDARAVDLTDSRIREGFRITGQILEQMKAKAERESARLIVVLLPDKPTSYARLVSQSGAGTLPDRFFHLTGLEEQLASDLRDLLARHRIEVIETADALAACFDRGVSPYPESDDYHPDSIGYRAVAQAISGYLARGQYVTGSIRPVPLAIQPAPRLGGE